MGGRIGYSAATGVMVILLSWFGIISLMTALIPVVAISPILLYIGMLIGSQAFQESPHKHAPAVIMAIVPSLAAWGKLQIDNSLGSVAGIHNITSDMIASMAQTGVFYHGLSILGGGSILAGVVLGAITVYIVERKFALASAFAFAGGVLTFFGLMHGEAIGINQTPTVAVSYVVVAGILFGCAKFATVSAKAGEELASHASEPETDGGLLATPNVMPQLAE